MRVLLLSVLLLCAGWSRGQDPLSPEDLRAFGEIPILHDGRVMPMDSFARVHLVQFSGRETVEGKTALQWMAETLFAPSRTVSNRVFMVNNPEVLESLELPLTEAIPGKRKPSTRRFSISHFRPALERLDEKAREAATLDPEDMGPVEKELLRLHNNVFTFLNLTKVFDLTRPSLEIQIQSPELRELLGVSTNELLFSVMDLVARADTLGQVVEAADPASPATWTLAQQEAFLLASRIYSAVNLQRHLTFAVLPAAPHGEVKWLSLWEAISHDAGDKELRAAVQHLAALARAYRLNDATELTSSARALEAFSLTRLGPRLRDVRMARSEAAYNRVGLFRLAYRAYLIAFFVGLVYLVTERRWFRRLALATFAVGTLVHLAGVVWRVILSARPPVTNLYGTFLFVGLLCALFALWIELRQKNGFGVFMGALVGASFLLVAARFGAEGDTMKKVVAVLASNFWLSTHVVAITAGYAGCWFAGMYGHLWLVLHLRRAAPAKLDSVARSMEGLLGFGLTFSFLGTMLGGVWADQSWGRFWGWDPKENGALLIVLWTAVIYHARIAGMIRSIGTAVGAVIGCVIVMIAWLGVNLLSVGLHNYGFSNAQAYGFFAFIAFETLFLGVVLSLIARRLP